MLKKVTAFVVLLLTITGCAALVINRSSPKRASLDKSVIPEFFNIPRVPAQIECQNAEEYDGYRTCEFLLESWYKSGLDKNDVIKGKLYLPNVPKRSNDGFLVLPGSGENFSSYAIAKSLAGAGFYVMRIYPGFKPLTNKVVREALNKPDAESAIKYLGDSFKQSTKQRIVDLMRLADFMEINYGVKKIHTIGVSLGGGIGSLFAAIDPRGEGLMIIISSASIARLLLDAASKENPPTQTLQDIKHLIYEKFGLSYKQALAMLKKELEVVEPLTYKDRLSKNKILLVSGALDIFGLGDSIIPYSATRETWKAYGEPEWIILTTGHFTAAAALLPFWLELPHLHHFFYTTYQSYLGHLINEHFLPKALN